MYFYEGLQFLFNCLLLLPLQTLLRNGMLIYSATLDITPYNKIKP